ncbi:putative Transaldolase [Seiridium cardinale]
MNAHLKQNEEQMYSRQDLVDLMPTYPRAHSSIVEALDSDSVECIPSDKDLLYTQTHFDFDSLLLKTNAYRAVRRRRPQRQATRSRKADVGTQAKEGDLIDLSSIVEIQATPVHRLSKDLECLTFGGEQLLTGLSMKDRKTSEDLVSFLDYPQQPALDTETLATLVRSAAEMRNAFDYIKRDITESESGIVAYVDKKSSLSNHRSCTIPSPQFTFGSPEAQVPSQMSLKAGGQESLATRKNNMSRRMLKVLDDKDTDLQRIEDMLMRAPSEAQSLEGAGEFNQSPTRVRLQVGPRSNKESSVS